MKHTNNYAGGQGLHTRTYICNINTTESTTKMSIADMFAADDIVAVVDGGPVDKKKGGN